MSLQWSAPCHAHLLSNGPLILLILITKIWLASYAEEKSPLINVNTFNSIPLDQYQRLRELGAPQAIPTMCVLVIKTDEQGHQIVQIPGLWYLKTWKPGHGESMNDWYLY
jgi:hypothetical protein